jgi:hypothetical protein
MAVSTEDGTSQTKRWTRSSQRSNCSALLLICTPYPVYNYRDNGSDPARPCFLAGRHAKCRWGHSLKRPLRLTYRVHLNRRALCLLPLSPLISLVGVRGFEPPAPASRTQCSTRLSYTPAEGGDIASRIETCKLGPPEWPDRREPVSLSARRRRCDKLLRPVVAYFSEAGGGPCRIISKGQSGRWASPTTVTKMRHSHAI